MNEPTIDYWMIALLRKATNMLMVKETSKYSNYTEYIRIAIEERNQWNPIGQLQVIQDRLNELQLFYDSEIKESLEARR